MGYEAVNILRPMTVQGWREEIAESAGPDGVRPMLEVGRNRAWSTNLLILLENFVCFGVSLDLGLLDVPHTLNVLVEVTLQIGIDGCVINWYQSSHKLREPQCYGRCYFCTH